MKENKLEKILHGMRYTFLGIILPALIFIGFPFLLLISLGYLFWQFFTYNSEKDNHQRPEIYLCQNSIEHQKMQSGRTIISHRDYSCLVRVDKNNKPVRSN